MKKTLTIRAERVDLVVWSETAKAVGMTISEWVRRGLNEYALRNFVPDEEVLRQMEKAREAGVDDDELRRVEERQEPGESPKISTTDKTTSQVLETSDERRVGSDDTGDLGAPVEADGVRKLESYGSPRMGAKGRRHPRVPVVRAKRVRKGAVDRGKAGDAAVVSPGVKKCRHGFLVSHGVTLCPECRRK